MKCSSRDIALFVAGAATAKALCYIMLGYAGVLPIHYFGIEWTSHLNMIGIAVSALVAAVLLWWSCKR